MFLPDWTDFYSFSLFEKEFGFEFNGEGWYSTETDTVLALDMNPEEGDNSSIMVHVWNKCKSDVLSEFEKVMKMKERGT